MDRINDWVWVLKGVAGRHDTTQERHTNHVPVPINWGEFFGLGEVIIDGWSDFKMFWWRLTLVRWCIEDYMEKYMSYKLKYKNTCLSDTCAKIRSPRKGHQVLHFWWGSKNSCFERLKNVNVLHEDHVRIYTTIREKCIRDETWPCWNLF